MKFRDLCWLWGHPEGRYNGLFGNERESRMTPMEFCSYLGIRNTFMVPVEWEINRRQYNKSFKRLRSVGWECNNSALDGTESLGVLLEEAKEFTNINCVVFDDFKGPFCDQISIDNLYKAIDRAHNNEVKPLDVWMVLYTNQFGKDEKDDADFQPYMDAFDGIIMWTWKERDVPLIPEKFEILKKYTPNTRRMIGLYLYNFGENKQATADAVKFQLDFAYDKIMKGEAEGVVFHTNTMADLDYEAYDVALDWMEEHGDDNVPEINL
ncbi:MAG: hypothetical protein E7641_01280 [Ruminococcaceae bacterium]|nr:hypothetical protein [Oscillospiraceae bacterium]